MGTLEIFDKPGAVEFDGQALQVIAHISQIAKSLHDIQKRELSEIVRYELSKASNSLDNLVSIMTALTETVDYFEIN